MSTPTATTSRSEYKLLDSNFLRGIRTAVMRIAGYIQEQRRSRATYLALRNLDDHMLRDIGLNRSDLFDLNTFGRNNW